MQSTEKYDLNERDRPFDLQAVSLKYFDGPSINDARCILEFGDRISIMILGTCD